jgi:hypothetical protein
MTTIYWRFGHSSTADQQTSRTCSSDNARVGGEDLQAGHRAIVAVVSQHLSEAGRGQPFEQEQIEAIEELRGEAEQGGVGRRVVNVERQGLRLLFYLKEHLELLFQNLISNAIKYRSPDRSPRIEIGAEPHADGWLFWVRDNGMGIERKYWERIFGMGEQLNSRSRYGGWGYGLAICEKTVLRHGAGSGSSPNRGRGAGFASRCRRGRRHGRGWRKRVGEGRRERMGNVGYSAFVAKVVAMLAPISERSEIGPRSSAGRTTARRGECRDTCSLFRGVTGDSIAITASE